MKKYQKKIFIFFILGLVFVLIQKIKFKSTSHTYFNEPLIKQDSIYIDKNYINQKYNKSRPFLVAKKGINKSELKMAIEFNSIICKLIKNQSNSIFKSHFKLWKLETPNDEAVLMLKSKDCPPGLFSYIVLDSDGNFKVRIDCHNTSQEELVLQAGIQGDIKESKPVKNQLNLAISGPGFFLEKCREKFYLIRKGHFFIATDSTLMTSNGCSLVDQNGVDFKNSSQELDSNACTSTQCLSIIQPREGEFKFVSRNRLSFSGSIEASRVESPVIFTNHLEEIDKDAGIIGPNFDLIPDFDKRSCI
jgi:hypothetical protein